MTKVELFEHIRRSYFVEKKTVREISRTFKIHRRTVRQAIASAEPPQRQIVLQSGLVLTACMKAAIDAWLLSDKSAPKKQRHTSHRIYKRLVDEYSYSGASPTIRKYLGKRRRQLCLSQSVFIPQVHQPGEEAEVDWYEAIVEFPWGQQKVQIFQMRACYSGKEFHCAFPRQTQQAFLEGHIQAFLYFGGVFHRIRYDNLTSAVKKILEGRRRKETERFILLRSHYLFESIFCRPGKEGAHEKGGVEGGVGRFRRHYLVPIPKCRDYDELNAMLLRACVEDNKRCRQGYAVSIEEGWNHEFPHLRASPATPFLCHEIRMPTVNQKGLVSVDQNHYSVPVSHVGCRVEVRLSSRKVFCFREGVCVATHERLHGKHQVAAKLDHYLDILRQKPGAFRGALPLAQARKSGNFPAVYETLWQAFTHRLGQSSGTIAMIDVLLLHRRYEAEEVYIAVQWALEMGSYHVTVIELLIRQHRGEHVLLDPLCHTSLKNYDRPVASLEEYNRLLKHH